MTMDSYFTVNEQYGPFKYKEKGSRFITFLFPADSKERAEEIIQELHKKYYDASHICYAYRLGEGVESYFRYNDDGEPKGTAGIPIYNELKRKDLYNVLLAVIRYFGGIKLGTGGLSRAYGTSAREIIEKSQIIQKQIVKKTSFAIPFNYIGEVTALVNQMKINIISQSYEQEAVIFTIEAPVLIYDKFRSALLDRSGGSIKIEKI